MRSLPLVAACSLLFVGAACGDVPVTSSSSTSVAPADSNLPSGSTGALPKPQVQLPAELPTTLVVTDLLPGSGPAAETGDTVVVHYVGVRSADGQEFDNSYDAGQPFPVTLGTQSVIAGWEEGLVGAQAGGRRQLDIPADLAYGDEPRGDIIQPGDALTFVIDVVAVVPVTDVAQEPAIENAVAPNSETLLSTELVTGTGPAVADGDTVAIVLVAYRVDSGEKVNSNWGQDALTYVVGEQTDVYPGLVEAVRGMQVGGRRQVQVPFPLIFDGQGNADFGVPPGVDVILVVDLLAVY
ncbi:MAG: FKBP-type peptidyl-prolyl cis-trans isomerase [Actinomycetota bacterium]|nr:FKBP-type peptidyl-prolyl cis-trans isomerase [Actinomycetota bacterium]